MKTELLIKIMAITAAPWIIVMLSEMNVAEVAVKIVNLGLGLY